MRSEQSAIGPQTFAVPSAVEACHGGEGKDSKSDDDGWVRREGTQSQTSFAVYVDPRANYQDEQRAKLQRNRWLTPRTVCQPTGQDSDT